MSSCIALLKGGKNALHWAAKDGRVSTIQYLAPKMQSLLNSTDNLKFTVLHCAAQGGHAEVVQLLINEYKLNPTARTKVCGHTCRCLARSSRASGGCALHVGGVHVVEMSVNLSRN